MREVGDARRQAGDFLGGGDQHRGLGIANDIVEAVGRSIQADIDHYATGLEDPPEGAYGFDAVAQAHHHPLLAL
ncbi:hypothetical protein D9M71_254180 [compost metagenome]